MSAPLGIVAPAVGVPERIVERFTRSLAESRPDCDYLLHVERQPDPDGFRIGRSKNRGILTLLDRCRIIVCTDVDMLIPPGLVDFTARETRDGRAVWAICRNVDPSETDLAPGESPGADRRPWDQWRNKALRRVGQGSWVGMTAADWLRTGGWDERLEGWGGDDVILAERRQENKIRTVTTSQFPLMHVNHPPRDENRGLRATGNQRNLRIGRTPPPRNFLAGRRPIDERNNHISLFVYLACQRQCPRCNLRARMRADPDYSMELEEIEELIRCTRDSGYRPYRSIILTGGEPLLWPHLEEAARMLRRAEIAHRIQVFTNGLAADRVTGAMMRAINWLRISRYRENSDAIDRLQARWGAKVVVVDRREQYAIPEKPLGPDVLPAKCACQGLGVYNRRVFACPNLVALPLEFGFSEDAFEEVSCPLQVGYQELLGRFPRYRHILCSGCVGNQRIRRR